ncbi:MAG TPA: FtsX-like permease family protein, partial [Savagea sp.]
MTLFDLVFRSMRRNIKHYYLYFFALIFTISLYFIFLSLQADGAVGEGVAASNSMIAGFKVANILLIAIALIFIAYSNAIFFNRRSKEVGIYQLIGLTKGTVAR